MMTLIGTILAAWGVWGLVLGALLLGLGLLGLLYALLWLVSNPLPTLRD